VPPFEPDGRGRLRPAGRRGPRARAPPERRGADPLRGGGRHRLHGEGAEPGPHGGGGGGPVLRAPAVDGAGGRRRDARARALTARVGRSPRRRRTFVRMPSSYRDNERRTVRLVHQAHGLRQTFTVTATHFA